MSDEDKELLARIGQLAGQINRHKNQQAGGSSTPIHRPAPHRNNVYRRHREPYPTRGTHRAPHPRPHQHRTLQFNTGVSHDKGTEPTASSQPGWVTKNDRHRQLINASVFEKQSQDRAKAIEETRKKKENGKRLGEKARLNEFLRRQQVAAGALVNANTSAASKEIVVEGIRFQVIDGGKKLARVAGQSNTLSPTPKTTVIAGVKFHRTKTGNLVVNRVVKDHRRSGAVKKVNEPCRIFSTTGSCPKGPRCRYIHDPDKVALCKDFLKEGRCAHGDSCDLSHAMTPERVPNCLHYAKGHCAKAECPFTHSKASPSAPVCRAFGFRGYCEKGAECAERHVFECPDFSNTGKCNIRGCKLLHRERASVLRNLQKPDEMMEDVSSDDDDDDDGAGDSDDVDSDEVAEFIDADSDASEVEDHQEFIAL